MSKEERQARRAERKKNRKPFFDTKVGGILKGVSKVVAPELVAVLEGAEDVGDAIGLINSSVGTPDETKSTLRELALREYEIDVMDRASAREAEIARLQSGGNNHLMNVLGWGVTICFILVIIVSLGLIQLPAEIDRDYYLYASGAVSSAFMTVLAYYFGSSAGSKEKTQLMKQ